MELTLLGTGMPIPNPLRAGPSQHLQLADTSVLFPLDFLRLPFIAAIAWALWGETFSPWTALGAAIIIASSAYAIRREARGG